MTECETKRSQDSPAPALNSVLPSWLCPACCSMPEMATCRTSPGQPESATTRLLPQPRMKSARFLASANVTASCTSAADLASTKKRAGPPNRNVVNGAMEIFSWSSMDLFSLYTRPVEQALPDRGNSHLRATLSLVLPTNLEAGQLTALINPKFVSYNKDSTILIARNPNVDVPRNYGHPNARGVDAPGSGGVANRRRSRSDLEGTAGNNFGCGELDLRMRRRTHASRRSHGDEKSQLAR